MELSCKVIDIMDSYIPNVKILNMDCGIASVEMDIYKDLNPANRGDTVNIGIYKSLPPYIAGKDFLAHGYVMSKRSNNDYVNIYISLWGYLVIIRTSEDKLDEYLNPMDKVYVKLWK